MTAICMDASVDLQARAYREPVGCGVPIKNGALSRHFQIISSSSAYSTGACSYQNNCAQAVPALTFRRQACNRGSV